MTERTETYRVRSARDAARVLDRFNVRGPRRVHALRSFVRADRAAVTLPGAVVRIERKG